MPTNPSNTRHEDDRAPAGPSRSKSPTPLSKPRSLLDVRRVRRRNLDGKHIRPHNGPVARLPGPLEDRLLAALGPRRAAQLVLARAVVAVLRQLAVHVVAGAVRGGHVHVGALEAPGAPGAVVLVFVSRVGRAAQGAPAENEVGEWLEDRDAGRDDDGASFDTGRFFFSCEYTRCCFEVLGVEDIHLRLTWSKR